MSKSMAWIIRVCFLIVFVASMATGLPQLWLALYGVGLVITPLFGRLYCAYACPMGTLMRPVQAISKKIGLQRTALPSWTFTFAIPVIVLVAAVASMIVGKRLTGKNIPVLPIITAISLVVTLFLPSAVWHNALCPFSVLLRLASRKPVWSYRVSATQCVSCNRCTKVCPSAAITVPQIRATAVLDASLCHQCGDCSRSCHKDAITYTRRQV